MSNLTASKKLKFESVFPFAFLLLFSIIMLRLIYSLNIPHSNQNPSLFVWLNLSHSVSNQTLLYSLATGEIATRI